MADFVRDDVTQHVADHFVRHRQLLRSRIQRRHLREVPGFHQFQHVVPENCVRGNDFTAARIHYRRPHCILAPARRPAHHVVTHVLRVPVGVFLRRGRIARKDGVAESGPFEHLLPVLDAVFDVRPPLLGHLVADIEHDGLDRIRYVGLGVLLLQPIALDERSPHLAVVVGAIVIERHREIAHAIVGVSWIHRLFRQQQPAGMEDESKRGLHAFRFVVDVFLEFRCGRHPGLLEADIDVLRESLHAFDEGAFRIDGVHVEILHELQREPVRHLADEQGSNVDDRRLVRPFHDDVEGLDDRAQRGRLHSALQAGHVLGPHFVAHVFEVKFVAAAHPADDAVIHDRTGSDKVAARG